MMVCRKTNIYSGKCVAPALQRHLMEAHPEQRVKEEMTILQQVYSQTDVNKRWFVPSEADEQRLLLQMRFSESIRV